MLRLPLRIPQIRMAPEAFVAPWPVELISSIPAKQYDSGPGRAFRRVAHVFIPDCKAGDILDCRGSFEVTNDLGYLVELAACLVLTPDAMGTAGLELMGSLSNSNEPSRGKFITRFPGFNVTPNGGMHHAYFPLSAHYVVPEGVTGDQYLAIVAYCGGRYYTEAESIAVEPYCGSISTLRWRNQNV